MWSGEQAIRKGRLKLSGIHWSCSPQADFLVTFYHQQQEETKHYPQHCLEMSSAGYSSSPLTHFAFNKTAGRNSAKLSATTEQEPASPSFQLQAPHFLLCTQQQSLEHPYFYQQSAHGNLGFFSHAPQNLILYQLTISKVTSTFLSICYSRTLFQVPKSVLYFHCCNNKYIA